MPISSLGAAHGAAALAALGFGTTVLATRKGTQLHRAIGIAYAVAMIAVNGTALTIYRLTGHFGPFHVLAMLSLGTIAAGVGVVMLRPRNWLGKHYRVMSFLIWVCSQQPRPWPQSACRRCMSAARRAA